MDTEGIALKVLLENAVAAERRTQLVAAANIWTEVRARYPECIEGFVKGGCILKQLGRLDEAEAVLRQARERFPNNEWIANEHAWSVHELGDFQAASNLWRDVRIQFPDGLTGYLGEALAQRKLHAFGEADNLYRLALRKFPAYLALLSDFAWSAEESRQTAEAVRRWEAVRQSFPDESNGHIRPGVLLLESGRLDDAEEMLAEAVRRFPTNEDAITSFAWVSHRRRDWLTALERWKVAVELFPQSPDARRYAAQVLLELGRYAEASAVLSPATHMFPNDEHIAVLNGWLATRQRDVLSAERIWKDVQIRFPSNVDGYRGLALALRDAGRLDEADALLQKTLERFPSNLMIELDFASLPQYKSDWTTAVYRWRRAWTRLNTIPEAWIGLAHSLLRSGDVQGSHRTISEAQLIFPNSQEIASLEAKLAQDQMNWPMALELWQDFRKRFPDDPGGQLGLGRALRECGHLELAESYLTTAVQHFPNRPDLEVELALTLSGQRKWRDAIAIFVTLRERFPNNDDVNAGISKFLERFGHRIADERDEPMVIPQILSESRSGGDGSSANLSVLLSRFQSLGDTCEFGMVQRIFRADAVALLRWARTSPEHLLTALNNSFDGVGDPEHTIIRVDQDEYVTEDRRYFMHSHTFTSPSAEPIEAFSLEHCRRLRWLRDKLLIDLKGAKKIFVYKSEEGISDSQATALAEAVARYNPENTLLCVRIQEPEKPSGMLQHCKRGLFFGYIDRFSTVDISVSVWLSLCQQVVTELEMTARAKIPDD